MNNEIGELDKAWLELQAIEHEMIESLAVLDALRSKGLLGFEVYVKSMEIWNRLEASNVRWLELSSAALRML